MKYHQQQQKFSKITIAASLGFTECHKVKLDNKIEIYVRAAMVHHRSCQQKLNLSNREKRCDAAPCATSVTQLH